MSGRSLLELQSLFKKHSIWDKNRILKFGNLCNMLNAFEHYEHYFPKNHPKWLAVDVLNFQFIWNDLNSFSMKSLYCCEPNKQEMCEIYSRSNKVRTTIWEHYTRGSTAWNKSFKSSQKYVSVKAETNFK